MPSARTVTRLHDMNQAHIEFERAVAALEEDLPHASFGRRGMNLLRQGDERMRTIEGNLTVLRNQMRIINAMGVSLGAQEMSAQEVPGLTSFSSSQAILRNVRALLRVKTQYVEGSFLAAGYRRAAPEERRRVREMGGRGSGGRAVSSYASREREGDVAPVAGLDVSTIPIGTPVRVQDASGRVQTIRWGGPRPGLTVVDDRGRPWVEEIANDPDADEETRQRSSRWR